MKGTAGLVGDALTFKWAQASMAQVAVNTIVVAEVMRSSVEFYQTDPLLSRWPVGSS